MRTGSQGKPPWLHSFGGDLVVSWAWIPIALVIGFVCGMFAVAFAEVSRHADEKKRKWWDDEG